MPGPAEHGGMVGRPPPGPATRPIYPGLASSLPAGSGSSLAAALRAWVHPGDWQCAATHSSPRPRAGAIPARSRSQDTQGASNVLFRLEESFRARSTAAPRRARREARWRIRIESRWLTSPASNTLLVTRWVRVSGPPCLYRLARTSREAPSPWVAPLAHPIASGARASPRAQVCPSASPTQRWTKGRTDKRRTARQVRPLPARGVPEPSWPRRGEGPHPHPRCALDACIVPPSHILRGFPSSAHALLIGGCNESCVCDEGKLGGACRGPRAREMDGGRNGGSPIERWRGDYCLFVTNHDHSSSRLQVLVAAKRDRALAISITVARSWCSPASLHSHSQCVFIAALASSGLMRAARGCVATSAYIQYLTLSYVTYIHRATEQARRRYETDEGRLHRRSAYRDRDNTQTQTQTHILSIAGAQ